MEDMKLSTPVLDALNPLKIGNIKERREYYRELNHSYVCENVKEETKAIKDPYYHPCEYRPKGVYEKVKIIYELPLSPSIITLTECKDTGMVGPLRNFEIKLMKSLPTNSFKLFTPPF
jgi:hypothetical protein